MGAFRGSPFTRSARMCTRVREQCTSGGRGGNAGSLRSLVGVSVVPPISVRGRVRGRSPTDSEWEPS